MRGENNAAGASPRPTVLQIRRVVPGIGAIRRRAAPCGRPYGKSGTSQQAFPRPDDHPREAPSRRGQKVSSIAHGRQQAGESRVGSRSAESRGRQGAEFEGKGILKDHGSLSRSLVTFCRHRKSLALRRNRSRGFRDIPPDAGRDHGTPFGGHRGRSPLYRNWVVGGFRKFSPSGETAAGLSATDHPMCCIFPYIQGGDKEKEKDKEKDYGQEKEKDARPGGPGTGGPAAAGRHYRDGRSEIGDKGAPAGPHPHASLFTLPSLWGHRARSPVRKKK